jgi:hypothetical protein
MARDNPLDRSVAGELIGSGFVVIATSRLEGLEILTCL